MFWKRWRRFRRQQEPTPLLCAAGDDLVNECHAFVLGRSAEYLSACGFPVPAWAWVNGLAHGTLEDVRVMARVPGGKHPRAFVAEMAGDIVARCDAGEMDLRAFQQDTLIPLELALSSWKRGYVPRSGNDLRNAICSVLAVGIQPIWHDHRAG